MDALRRILFQKLQFLFVSTGPGRCHVTRTNEADIEFLVRDVDVTMVQTFAFRETMRTCVNNLQSHSRAQFDNKDDVSLCAFSRDVSVDRIIVDTERSRRCRTRLVLMDCIVGTTTKAC